MENHLVAGNAALTRRLVKETVGGGLGKAAALARPFGREGLKQKEVAESPRCGGGKRSQKVQCSTFRQGCAERKESSTHCRSAAPPGATIREKGNAAAADCWELACFFEKLLAKKIFLVIGSFASAAGWGKIPQLPGDSDAWGVSNNELMQVRARAWKTPSKNRTLHLSAFPR